MGDYARVELPDGLYQLFKLAKQSEEDVTRQLGAAAEKSDPISSGLVMVSNHVLLSLEILKWYYSLWDKGVRAVSLEQLKEGVLKVEPRPVDEIKQENAKRVIEVLKSLYLLSMSSIEYSAKQAIQTRPAHCLSQSLRQRRRLYLSDIVQKSEHLGLIDDSALNEWKHLIFLRNVVVHNNGISDRDTDIQIEGMELLARNGQMVQGKLDTFAVLTRATIRLFRDWGIAILRG